MYYNFENEIHLIMECPRYKLHRDLLLMKAEEQIPSLMQMNITKTFEYLMRFDDNNIKKIFTQFMKCI